MVTITNCTVTGSFEEGSVIDGSFKRFAADAEVGRTGRIKFGTESNGGFKNITISNCVFDGCRGLAIESVDGGIISKRTKPQDGKNLEPIRCRGMRQDGAAPKETRNGVKIVDVIPGIAASDVDPALRVKTRSRSV